MYRRRGVIVGRHGLADGLLGDAEALEHVVLAVVVVPELAAVVHGLVAEAELQGGDSIDV